jgi:hypothetical protein
MEQTLVFMIDASINNDATFMLANNRLKLTAHLAKILSARSLA